MEEKEFATFGMDMLKGDAKFLLTDLNKSTINTIGFADEVTISDLSKPITIGSNYDKMIKILVIPSDTTGVGKYRSIDPHKMIQRLFKNEFHVEINLMPPYDNPEYFKKFDIIHIHKAPSNDYEKGVEIINRLKSFGCKVILDIDDYWEVDSFNPHYYGMKKNKVNDKLRAIIEVSDWVTTTTPIFAKEIRKFNKNVMVIPNAIDPEEVQFKPNPIPSDRIRIGFLGGSTHQADIMLLSGAINRLIEHKDKIQTVLIGFDLRGSMIEGVENGKLKRRAMTPEETVWNEYESVFTSKWNLLKDYPDYLKYLQKYTPELYDPSNPDKEKNMPYRRLWTRDINNYARNYNNLDISLAPLVENKFNLFKSQLKVVEAGFHKKALVAQNYGPYTLDLVNIFDKDKINPKGNAVLIDSYKNHKQWYQALKRLIDNPELITMLGENLYETVKEKYDLRKVTESRANFYKTIV